MKNIISVGRLVILILIIMILIVSTFLFTDRAQDEPDYAVSDRDMLAYVTEDDRLMLYDPRTRTETELLDNVSNFVLSREGRIAFTGRDQTDKDIYVLDPSIPDIAPINISQNPDANNYPLAWSPDGRYLAFDAYQDRYDRSLYVWDGVNTTNITPDNGLDTANFFYVDWSDDGRLAFTIRHGWSDADIPPEIYLWDGDTTTNLIQNPDGWDWGARWNRIGQLMFGLTLDGEGGFYVWDGMSFKDGSPDADTFIRIAPESELNYPVWLEDGIIGFTMYTDSPAGYSKHIILWDMEAEAIIEQFPISSENAWNWLAEGGQMIFSEHLASGIPSYYLDVENIEGDILFSEHVGEYAWSADGYLAYCGITDEGRSRLLSIWDGEETWVVAETSYRPARWKNGEHTFSCNNG